MSESRCNEHPQQLLWYYGAYEPYARTLTDTAHFDDDESDLIRRLY
jgi:hypothetical protein